MRQFLIHLSIPRRLLFAAALAALIPGIIIVVLGSSYAGALISVNNVVQASNDAVQIATDIQANLLRMNALLETLDSSSTTLPRNVKTSREIMMITKRFDTSLATYQRDYHIVTSPKVKNVFEALQESTQGQEAMNNQHILLLVVRLQWKTYLVAQNKALNDVITKAPRLKLANDIDQADLEYLSLKSNLDNLVVETESISRIVTEGNTLKIKPILFWTALAVLISTLAVLFITHIINKTITDPLSQLVRLTQRISEGDTSARAEVPGHDEIQQVAVSMNTMLDSIVKLVQDIEGQRDALQAHVEQLILQVKGLGKGDLRTEAEVTTDELGFLAASFNYMIKALSSLVIRVKQVAYDVDRLTGATSARMTQLALVGDRQIQDMGDAVNVVEQMAVSTREVANRADVLSSISHKTQISAQTGRKALDQAGEGIHRIHDTVQVTAAKCQVLDESSRQVDSIVNVIANIAHQTNRLALDASIQAALAGEHGKGFAAVATDIRRLAEQTKSQVHMIVTLGRTITENIGTVAQAMNNTEHETAKGAKLATQGRAALTSIFDLIDYQTRAIEDINISAMKQLQFSKDVRVIIQRIADATRESGSSLREMTCHMAQLTQLVERLRDSVGAFRLRDEQITRPSLPKTLPQRTSFHAITLQKEGERASD